MPVGPKLMQILKSEIRLCFVTWWLDKLEGKHKCHGHRSDKLCRLLVLYKESQQEQSCWEQAACGSSTDWGTSQTAVISDV